MKRALGAMAANWLRKPQNQERIKLTARDVWGKFQQRRNARKGVRTDADTADATRQTRRASTDRNDD